MRNRHTDNHTARNTARQCTAALALMLLAVVVTSSRAAAARVPVADFAPTLSPAAAAARVATARETAQQLHDEAAPAAPIDALSLPSLPTLYFEQTRHHLSNRAGFLDFWRANGQLLIFGYPISEELVEGGRVVQYFERARFEFHPERLGQAGQVQLGLIGRELAASRSEPGFLPVADPQDGATYFPETGHTLRGEFRHFWERRGGLAIFGFPISEPFDEAGQLVQYFERARFSHNPGDMEPFYRSMEQANGINLDTLYEVQLGHVGRERADAQGVNTAGLAPLAGARAWSPVLWERRIQVDLSAQWLTAYEGELVVYRAPVATGRDGFNTPTGDYAIYDRLRAQTMVGDAAGESWYVPDVPWVMYVVGGVALHGTYWHDRFGTGTRMSHGCINLSMDDARWLYEWADIGTAVRIFYT
jgi:hypothetical protein